MFFIGDFNGHSQLWWQGGDSTPESNSIEDLTHCFIEGRTFYKTRSDLNCSKIAIWAAIFGQEIAL